MREANANSPQVSFTRLTLIYAMSHGFALGCWVEIEFSDSLIFGIGIVTCMIFGFFDGR
jgi:hypothetical protein